MSLFSKLRHALLGRPQPKVTRREGAESMGMWLDELQAVTLKVADVMRYDPPVRVGRGARNSLLMAAQRLTVTSLESLRDRTAAPGTQTNRITAIRKRWCARATRDVAICIGGRGSRGRIRGGSMSGSRARLSGHCNRRCAKTHAPEIF